MLTVKELQSLARKLTLEEFCWQLGPFALIQRPPDDQVAALQALGLPVKLARTRIAHIDAMKSGGAAVVRDFENLSVTTLPPLKKQDKLVVGRQPDCDLVLEHASVSKQHAVLRWDEELSVCSVKDLGSTNGTLVDSDIRVRGEVALNDGDIITFGEAHFWYLRTATLYARLRK